MKKNSNKMSWTNDLGLQMTAENMNNQEMGQPAELFIKKTY